MLTQPIRDVICHCQLSPLSLLAENSVTTKEVLLKITAANLYNTRASRRRIRKVILIGRKKAGCWEVRKSEKDNQR